MPALLANFAIYPLSLLAVLTLVVTVHELGHFLTAKACGVRIDAFSIGFGRAVAKWRDKAGVEWRIGWMPLGGYVRFSGDENVASVPDQDDLTTLRKHIIQNEGPAAVAGYYHFKPVWQRALIAVAGPMANFILAILLFAVMGLSFGKVTIAPRIAAVTPGSVAEAAGFKAGDLVVQVDSVRVDSYPDMASYTRQRADIPITFRVVRGGVPITLVAAPKAAEVTDRFMGRHQEGRLGVEFRPTRADVRHVPISLPQALPYGAGQTWDIVRTTGFYLGRLVTGHVPADQISGFIGIAKASGEVAKAGAEGESSAPRAALGVGVALLNLSAFLSVSIGFMNLLPIPVLDGGHLLFYAYEAVARRPLAAKVQALSYRAGLALLVGFMLFAAWNDLLRYDVFKTLGSLFS